MRKLLIISIFIFIIYSCTKDQEISSENVIYTNTEEYTLKEILLFLRPYTIENNDTLFLTTDSLYNIKVNINAKPVGTFNSLPLNTTSKNDTINKLLFTKIPIKYPVIIKTHRENQILQTAGEYANLLINSYSLKPGFYFISIPSFYIKLTDGTQKVVYTPICEIFEVKQNITTLFIGTFNVYVN